MVFIMIKMDDIIPVMLEAFENDKTFTFPVNGRSMSPFLKKDDLVTVSKCDEIKKGDVILFKRTLGGYVLHRVKRVKNDEIVVYGDRQLNYETLDRSQVIAIMVSKNRNGKEISLDKSSYKMYKAFVKLKLTRLIFKVFC